MKDATPKRNPVEELAESFMQRFRHGERPSMNEYIEKHPELADEIRELFPALAMMEDVAPYRRDSFADATKMPTAGSESPPLEQLGDFRIIREVGLGGMGVVYEAEQESLGRHVALKVLSKQTSLDSKQQKRFEREARAAAKLHHTNIVPVFGVGESDGMRYYVMQFIHGLGLDEVLVELKRLHDTGDFDLASGHIRLARDESRQEDRRPVGREVSAADVAQSLLTGRFDRRLITGDSSSAPDDLVDEALERAKSELLSKPPAASGDTAIGRLSDTASLSESAVLPGRSAEDEKSGSRSTYWQSVARIGAQVAEALEYAHNQGILHRDIKPANLLLDAHGTAWVTDFGLAKTDDQQNLTGTGDIVGTLRYMAPEMFSGTSDARSDVYALGLTLYELLALKPAFDAADRYRLIRQVTTQEPQRLRTLNADIPRDLETIVHKAIDRDPAHRYQTPGELAADLERYLGNQPVLARRISSAARFGRWCKRNPMGATVAGLLLAGLIASFAAAVVFQKQARENSRLAEEREFARTDAEEAKRQESIQRKRAEREKKEAERQEAAAVKQRAQAEQQRDETRRYLYVAHMNLAQRAWEEGNAGRVLDLLEGQKPERTGGVDLRGWEWHYQWRLSHSERQTFAVETDSRYVTFSPDGRLLASGAADGSIRLWDVTNANELWSIQTHSGRLWSIAFRPDGAVLASGGEDGIVKLWNVTSGELIRTLKGHTDRVASVAFSPDGRLLASGSRDDTVKLWEPSSGQLLRSLTAPSTVYNVAFSPDGKRLAAGSGDRMQGTVTLWDPASGQELRRLEAHHMRVPALAFSPDGRLVASGSRDGTIKLWDVAEGEILWTLTGHAGGVLDVAFSPDGHSLASSGTGATVKLWETVSGEQLRTLKGHTGQWVRNVAFSPDGWLLASLSEDGVKLWDAASRQEPQTLEGHRHYVNCVAFSPDGQLLASACEDRTVKLWDVASGRELRTLDDPHTAVRHLAFSPDGKLMTAGLNAPTVKLWDPSSGQQLRTLKGASWPAAFSPDGRHLVSGSSDATLKLWDMVGGQEIHILTGHTGSIEGVAFSPDGRLLASASADQTVKLWDTRSGQQLRSLEGHTASVRCLAFSPNGRLLASCSPNGLKLWDAADGRQLRSLNGHTSAVTGVAFNPDGQRLASCSLDGTVKLWDGSTGQEVTTFKAHTNHVKSVAFSPDGSRLASCSKDRTIKIWDARPLTTELRAELLAFDLLETLYSEPLSKADIIQQIRTDSRVAESVRQRALDLADSYWQREVTREASSLVESLFAKPLLKEEVIKAIQGDAETSDDVRHKAVELAKNWRKGEFRKRYERAIALDSDEAGENNNSAWFLATCPDSDFREPVRAVALAEKAVQLDPGNGAFRDTLGVAYYRAGNWPGAIEEMKASCELSLGRYVRINALFLAMAHWKQGELEQARKWYVAADCGMQRHKSNLDLLRFRDEAAALLEPDEHPVQAPRPGDDPELELYTRILEADPQAAWAYSRRSQVHERLNHSDQAQADQQKAGELYTRRIERKPDDPIPYRLRARYYCELGRWSEATADYKAVLTQDNEHYYDHYRHALLCLASDGPEKYRESCRTMLQQLSETDNVLAQQFIAWTCSLRPDALDSYDQPIALATKAVEAQPNSNSFLNTLGVILYRAGRHDEALGELTKLAERMNEPDSKDNSSPAYTWFFLAMAHYQRGETDEAKQWLEQADAWTEKVLAEHTSGSGNQLPWNRRLTLRLLHAEAEKLLTSGGPVAAPKPVAPIKGTLSKRG